MTCEIAPANTAERLQSLPKPRTPLGRSWTILKSRRAALVSLGILIFFIVLAVFADWVSPYDPASQQWTQVRKPPSLAHPFGTDEVGRDILSRIIHGARASLGAGITSVLIAMFAGVPLGLLSGYVGGFIGATINRFADAMLACPFLILAIALAAFLGPKLSNAMVAIGITVMPVFILLTRSEVMNVMTEDYVEAARAVGNPPWRIAFLYVLPNVTPALLVQGTLSIATAIIAEASLSFLGLGQQPPEPSWGSMLNSAQRFLLNAPWMAVWPGMAIFIVVLSLNLLGDGLRDAFDPKSKL